MTDTQLLLAQTEKNIDRFMQLAASLRPELQDDFEAAIAMCKALLPTLGMLNDARAVALVTELNDQILSYIDKLQTGIDTQ
jgi:hypothetical protein